MTVNSLNSVNSATSLNLSEHVVQGQEHHESGPNGGQDGAEPKQAAVMDGAKGGKSKQQDTKEILKGYRERAICIVSGE